MLEEKLEAERRQRLVAQREQRTLQRIVEREARERAAEERAAAHVVRGVG